MLGKIIRKWARDGDFDLKISKSDYLENDKVFDKMITSSSY